MIERLLQAALAEEPGTPDRVVVTVPASSQAAQRRDTLEAARLAGLKLSDGDIDAAVVNEVLIPQLAHENAPRPFDLTFEDKKKVLEPSLQTENFRRYTPRRIERLLFVAITPAQGWAYLSTVVEGKTMFAPLERLVTRPTGCNWAVQDRRKIPPVYEEAAPAAPPPDGDLTSLL